jgi:hypothetical protein
MEDWEVDFEWLKIRHHIKDSMKKDVMPDLNAILMLIGVQELGYWKKPFSKEEKQDLMHIAVCRLLSDDGFYEFIGRDTDGWPHYNLLKPVGTHGEKSQEILLKKKIVAYFKENNDNI